MNVINVGSANAHEAVLAINVPMSFDSARTIARYSALAKTYLFAV